jgi:hypothetical protein
MGGRYVYACEEFDLTYRCRSQVINGFCNFLASCLFKRIEVHRRLHTSYEGV